MLGFARAIGGQGGVTADHERRSFFGQDLRAALIYGFKPKFLESTWITYPYSKITVEGSLEGQRPSQPRAFG